MEGGPPPAVAPAGMAYGPQMGGAGIPANRVDGNTVTAGLGSNITAIVAAVMAAYPQVAGISGLRPGDHGSQHSVGTAFDLDIAKLTVAQKQQLVSALLSGAFGRVGGIGTYNEQATSLHVDTREGRMAWGPNKSRTSLGQTPDWFEAMTTAWMQGATPGGKGASAAQAENDLASLRTTREEEAKLLELQRERKRIAAELAASSEAEAADAARKAEAEAYAAGFAPERQQLAYQEKLSALRLQDDAAAAKRMRQLDEETRQAEERVKLANLTGREREIELRVLERINAEKAAGRVLDDADIASIRENITRQVNAGYNEAETHKQVDRYKQVWLDAANSIGSALEGAMRSAVMNGKIDAEQILKSLVADITTAIFRAYITAPLIDGITQWIGSHGGAFDAGRQIAFASGGIVASPTLFKMAGGAGLMGEAGPEAIMPLKRGPDGKLGVASSGGSGTSVVINDMRQAPGAEPVEVREEAGPDGQRMISIMVRDEVRRQVRNGDLDKEMRSSFGVTRQLTRR